MLQVHNSEWPAEFRARLLGMQAMDKLMKLVDEENHFKKKKKKKKIIKANVRTQARLRVERMLRRAS